MKAARKLGRILSAIVLKLSLVGFAVAFALLAVIGTPEPLKTSLGQSGVYSAAVDSVIEASAEETDQSLPLDEPAIQQAARDAFNPWLLEQSAHRMIDGLYAWLEGDTDEIEFTIDLSDAKALFIERVADYAEQRVNNLRPCTQAEAFQLAQQDSIDPFELDCRPPVVISQYRDDIIRELEQSEDFLDDPVITAESLADQEGATTNEPWQEAPAAFQRLQWMPLATGLFAFAAAVFLIALHANRRSGLRQVSMIIFSTGVLVLISALVLDYLIRHNIAQGMLFDMQDTVLQGALVSTSVALYGYFSRAFILISAIYLMSGAISLGIFWLLRKPKNTPDTSQPPRQPNSASHGKKPTKNTR
ncbi:MAG: hypothetical protein U5K77_01635 [Candidatus Saccharibacteria bacterium]|nr:hypothetical protein [Candidatus Saccharibacteria bacterium]